VNEFVEECRREWKRLGVPDPVAGEMAADLEADLEEAEAEGVSAEEVLGSGAFNPRSFARAWAVERGVVRRLPPNRHLLEQTSRIVAATGVFALMAVIGGVLVIVAASSSPTRLALIAPVDLSASADPGPTVIRLAAPPSGALDVTVDGQFLRLPLPLSPSQVAAVDSDASGVDTRTVGWVLLTVGLAGVVSLTMLILWAAAGGLSRRRKHTFA